MKLLLIAMVIALSSCRQEDIPTNIPPIITQPGTPSNPSDPPTTPPVTTRISLSWEASHPERKLWTDAMMVNIDKYYGVYNIARDTTRICPRYVGLPVNTRKKVIGEFFVAVAQYESGFNPKSEAVDVGTPGDKNSWSVGLFQMSGNDGAARALKVDYYGLKDPVNNINVALYQFNTQVTRTGLFILPNGSSYRYWAVILDGNKYSQIGPIIARVRANVSACN